MPCGPVVCVAATDVEVLGSAAGIDPPWRGADAQPTPPSRAAAVNATPATQCFGKPIAKTSPFCSVEPLPLWRRPPRVPDGFKVIYSESDVTGHLLKWPAR